MNTTMGTTTNEIVIKFKFKTKLYWGYLQPFCKGEKDVFVDDFVNDFVNTKVNNSKRLSPILNVKI